RDSLLLVAEHQGNSGVERKSITGHADHHSHGGRAPDMVGNYVDQAGIPAGTAAYTAKPTLWAGSAWLLAAHLSGRKPHQGLWLARDSDRLRALSAGHERRGIAGPG